MICTFGRCLCCCILVEKGVIFAHIICIGKYSHGVGVGEGGECDMDCVRIKL